MNFFSVAQGNGYSILLIILCILLAIISSFTSLALMDKIDQIKELRRRRTTLILSGFALGTGSWMIYIIGISKLAYDHASPVSFSMAPIILSFLVSCLVSVVGCYYLKRLKGMFVKRLVYSVLMASSMKVVHFLVLQSAQMEVEVAIPVVVHVTSIMGVTLTSFLGIWLYLKYTSVYMPKTAYWKLLSAILFGISILTIQYISFGGARFTPLEDSIEGVTAQGVDALWLGLLALMLELTVVLIVLVDRKFMAQDALKFKSAFEHSPESVCTIDLKGVLISANKSTADLLGYSVQELIGTPFIQYVKPVDIEIARQHFQKCLGGNHSKIEFSVIRKSGESVEVVSFGIPIWLSDSIVGVCGFGKDITEHKMLLSRLTEHDMHYKSLFDNELNAIFLINESGKIMTANPLLLQMTGYNLEELNNMYLYDFLTTERAEGLNLLLHQNLEVQRFTSEMVLTNKFGVEMDVAVSCNPVYIEEQYKGTYCLARDITYRKHIEKKLQENLDRDVFQEDRSDPGKILRILMAQRDINTTELATKTCLSQATISNLRTGKITKPQSLTAQLISEALGVEMGRIWSDVENEDKNK